MRLINQLVSGSGVVQFTALLPVISPIKRARGRYSPSSLKKTVFDMALRAMACCTESSKSMFSGTVSVSSASSPPLGAFTFTNGRIIVIEDTADSSRCARR
ncbi:hypothetical protein MRX96_014657 [Rhipicephalus microplus]